MLLPPKFFFLLVSLVVSSISGTYHFLNTQRYPTLISKFFSLHKYKILQQHPRHLIKYHLAKMSVCFPNSMSILSDYNIDYLTATLKQLAIAQSRSSTPDSSFSRDQDDDDDIAARAIMSLDEDIPEAVDINVRKVINEHIQSTTGSFGPMEFLVSEEYREYKEERAKESARVGKLPRSKRSRENLK